MAPITTSIDVARPPAQVFAYVTDPTRFPEWQQGVVSGGMKEPGIPTVGSHCMMVRRIGGAERPSTSVLTKLSPPTSWAVDPRVGSTVVDHSRGPISTGGTSGAAAA